ncbi:MAG: hypothetical protein ACXADY_18750 [Candidatus Hodarchaeales archaeon]
MFFISFTLDPYEVAEIQALLRTDLIVPLDKIVIPEDPPEVEIDWDNNLSITSPESREISSSSSSD